MDAIALYEWPLRISWLTWLVVERPCSSQRFDPLAVPPRVIFCTPTQLIHLITGQAVDNDKMASEGKVVLTYDDITIRQSDYDCIASPSGWLNDIAISFWLNYLTRDWWRARTHEVFVIYPEISQLLKSPLNINEVKSIIESTGIKEKFASLKLILIPINDMSVESTSAGGTHWSLLIYLPVRKIAVHYDSHGDSNMAHAKRVYSRLMDALELEAPQLTAGECTQQSNCHDCGIHVCANSQALCKLCLGTRDHFDKGLISVATKEFIQQYRNQMVETLDKFIQESKSSE